MWTNYLTNQKNVTGHMLNIKLEKKSYKMSFKELLVKIQWLENQRVRVGGGGAQGTPWGQIGFNPSCIFFE